MVKIYEIHGLILPIKTPTVSFRCLSVGPGYPHVRTESLQLLGTGTPI